MSRKYKVVAVSGSVQDPSRTLSLVYALLRRLGRSVSIDAHVIELGKITPALAGVSSRQKAVPDLEAQIEAIESADLLVVASPVYRGSYTGLFKHLFDLVHHDALIGVPVLLAATGGSDRHALVIDHQLRPLFSFFQALTAPIGVYASERDFTKYEVSSPELTERIELAITTLTPLLGLRPVRDADASTAIRAA